jgi:hypothetical protein
MITEGLQDIRGRLECITVTEIIGQIPEGFRADLQRQLMEAARQTVLDLTERLNTIPFEEINKNLDDQLDKYLPTIERKVGDRIQAAIPQIEKTVEQRIRSAISQQSIGGLRFPL